MENSNTAKWAIVEAGESLLDMIKFTYGIDRPLMLHGPHGIGKSEILAAAARSLGIDHIVIDLSIMEPTDLVGLPERKKGRTFFAPPSFLPEEGQGLFIIEELNRAPRYMQTPCLQLLTARKINNYQLPPGWVPVASVNPSQNGYFVDELDEALESRWINVTVRPDENQWVAWGNDKGIHPVILDYVKNAKPFTDPVANPRAWYYAADILASWEKSEKKNNTILKILLSGVLTCKWADSFLCFYNSHETSLSPEQIIDEYSKYQIKLQSWVQRSRLDQIQSTLWRLQRYLQENDKNNILQDSQRVQNIENFLEDIPIDLLQYSFAWLKNLGLENYLSEFDNAPF